PDDGCSLYAYRSSACAPRRPHLALALASHEVQSVDPFGAKLWVKNPGGAILRSESNGVPSAISLKAAGPSLDSTMLNARGLETHPPGEAAGVPTSECGTALA